MEDLQTLAPVTETPPDAAATTLAPEEGASSVSEDTRPAWQVALDEAPADEIRKHSKWAGMLGSERQRWEREFSDKKTVEVAMAERARIAAETERAEKELDELYEQNPLAYADRMQNSREIKRAQAHIQKLHEDSRNAVADSIGKAFREIPEWEAIVNNPVYMDRLTSAIQGLPEDQVIPAWNRAAVDIVAAVRGDNRAEEQFQARLKLERQAWETEALATGLITTDRPGLNRGRGVSSNDPEPNWKTQPAEYAAWYKRNT